MRVSVILIVALLIINGKSFSQKAIDTAVAKEVSRVIKDSLKLTDAKSAELLKVEIMIRLEKRKIREAYRNTPKLDSLMHHQDLRRDSLYRVIIGEEKYSIYKNKRNSY